MSEQVGDLGSSSGDRAPLSPTQRKVFDRLLEHYRRTGKTPELSEMARSLGMHYVSLRQHLEALHRKGHLSFESRGRGRPPVLSLPAVATGIPLLGEIPAGSLDSALASADAYLTLGGLGDESFALRVRGDSMADLIQPSDVVLLARRPPQRSGEICAVRVEDEESTLKYLERHANGTVTLRPHNPDYQPLHLDAADVTVDGVYRGLLRGSVADALIDYG